MSSPSWVPPTTAPSSALPAATGYCTTTSSVSPSATASTGCISSSCFDQPHELLRGVADLLGRGAEVQQAAQARRIDGLGRGAQHPELELLAHLVEPVLELAHLRGEP